MKFSIWICLQTEMNNSSKVLPFFLLPIIFLLFFIWLKIFSIDFLWFPFNGREFFYCDISVFNFFFSLIKSEEFLQIVCSFHLLRITKCYFCSSTFSSEQCGDTCHAGWRVPSARNRDRPDILRKTWFNLLRTSPLWKPWM